MSRRLVVLIVLAAFGPYLVGGIRLDQVVVYGLIAVAGVPLIARARFSPAIAAVQVLWLGLVAVAVVGWLATTRLATDYGPGNPVANLDNLLLPLACSLLVVGLAWRSQPAALDRPAALAVVVAMCANALLAVAQFRGWGIAGSLAAFWGQGGTADRAATLGRYSGMFSQPSLAGVAYSLALVCAVYALQKRPILQSAAVALLLIGGLLTLSKGFLLIGLPVAAWVFLRGQGGSRLLVALVGAVSLVVAVRVGFATGWTGLDTLLNQLPGGGSSLSALTGNRYGERGSTHGVRSAVLDHYPWGGYGAPGLATATDSAFVFSLVVAGLIGVALTVAVLAVVAVGYLSRRKAMGRPERTFYGAVVTIVAVSSFGTPLLTGNRTSVIVWVLLTLLLARPAAARPEAAGSRRAAARSRADGQPASAR